MTISSDTVDVFEHSTPRIDVFDDEKEAKEAADAIAALSTHENRSNEATPVQVAHLRYLDGDDHLRLQLTLHNDQKTFFRPIDERLDKIRYRLQILAMQHQEIDNHTLIGNTISKKMLKTNIKKRKNGCSSASNCQQRSDALAKKIAVRFFTPDGQELTAKSLVIGDALMRTTRLTIGDFQYIVLKNQPRVLKLNVMKPVLAGIPIVPLPDTEFCAPDDCLWKWFRFTPSKSQPRGELCCRARRYVPTDDEIGCWYRIECHAPSLQSHYAVDSVTDIVTSHVIRGPNRDVFQERKALGQAPASLNGFATDAFRVLSYNVLFDGYTTSHQAQTMLFPYADPSIMDEMYRMQLVFQEIEETNPDIVCLQEMGEAIFHKFFEPMMAPLGYHTFYSGKSGTTHEGCAIFARKSVFQVLQEHTLDLSMTIKHSPDPAIQQVLHEYPEIARGVHKAPSIAQLLILQCALDPLKHVVLSNTHLFYREDAHMIRLLQSVVLARQVEKLRLDVGGHTAVIMAGDYNAFPATAPIDFLLNGGIDADHKHWQEAPGFRWDRSKNGKTMQKKPVPYGSFEHQLDLSSACGIPAFTNYAGTFIGTLDYILIGNERLRVERVFPMFSHEAVAEEVALPSSKFPSDHVALICDLAWIDLPPSRRNSVVG